MTSLSEKHKWGFMQGEKLYWNTNLFLWKQSFFLLDWCLAALLPFQAVLSAFSLIYSLSLHAHNSLEPRKVQAKCWSLSSQSVLWHDKWDFICEWHSISHLDFKDEWRINLENCSALKNKRCLTVAKATHDRELLYESLIHSPLYRIGVEFLSQSTTGVICDSPVLAGTIPFLVPTTKTFILQCYQGKLLLPCDNLQQNLTSVLTCFKSSFKDTNLFCTSFSRKAVSFQWGLQIFSILPELLISFIAFASFLSGYTNLFPFPLTQTYLIIIILYSYEWLTLKTFISRELAYVTAIWCYCHFDMLWNQIFSPWCSEWNIKCWYKDNYLKSKSTLSLLVCGRTTNYRFPILKCHFLQDHNLKKCKFIFLGPF